MANILSREDALRADRTMKRMKKQKELTEHCQFNLNDFNIDKVEIEPIPDVYVADVNTDGSTKYHLISEGVLVDALGNPIHIIKKNSVKEWYDELDSNVILDINLQHDKKNPLFRQIGTFSKSDLTLTENEDGRHSLYVNLNLDEDSLVIKELRRKKSLLGLSIEFYSDQAPVQFSYENNIYNCRLHENIDIVNFAIVGEPHDALSGNVELKLDDNIQKEEPVVEKKGFLEALKGLVTPEVQPTPENSEEFNVEEPVVEKEVTEEAVIDDGEVLETILNQFTVLNERFDSLEKKNAELEKQNEKYAEEIKALNEKETKFSIEAPTFGNKKPVSIKPGM